MNILSPSILAADFWKLGEQIMEVQKAGAGYLHVDVMDGRFVPSISFGMPVLASIRKSTDMFLDVHLMIEEPEKYVEDFVDCGANLVNFHVEAAKNVGEILGRLKKRGVKTGLTIKPETPAEALEPYLDQIDMVLIMTVEPGFGGQKLIEKCVEKVTCIRGMIQEKGLLVDVEVDGGITADNVHKMIRAGANVIVAGSAIFKADIQSNVKLFLEKMG